MVAYLPIYNHLTREAIIQDALSPFPVTLNKFRVHDAQQTNLPGTAATDDLALITGSLGTKLPSIRTSDGKNTTVNQYARTQFRLPPNYDPGETVTIRLNAGMVTTVASTTGAVDVECYQNGTGSDLCATAQTSCNNLTPADKDFTITPTDLVPGDLLDIRIKGAIVDSGTGTAVIVEVNKVTVLLDTRC